MPNGVGFSNFGLPDTALIVFSHFHICLCLRNDRPRATLENMSTTSNVTCLKMQLEQHAEELWIQQWSHNQNFEILLPTVVPTFLNFHLWLFMHDIFTCRNDCNNAHGIHHCNLSTMIYLHMAYVNDVYQDCFLHVGIRQPDDGILGTPQMNNQCVWSEVNHKLTVLT